MENKIQFEINVTTRLYHIEMILDKYFLTKNTIRFKIILLLIKYLDYIIRLHLKIHKIKLSKKKTKNKNKKKNINYIFLNIQFIYYHKFIGCKF